MVINISKEIESLLDYAIEKELISPLDRIYTKNRLLEVLELTEIDEYTENHKEKSLESILENILSFASDNGVLKDGGVVAKDLFDTKIMGCLIGRPSEIIEKFNSLYEQDNKKATDYFYNLSRHSNYIRWDRVQKDLKWKVNTEYGDIDITINLSKPEKDPKAIALAKNMPSSSYPKCLLCRENEGYAGRINHPARQNHRIIPLNLNSEDWYLQYSPYVYYNEHCIVFKGSHEPMKIGKESFVRLLQFVDKFPHYFLGSNADLPIVGGSILTHDHFQGGNYEFAMATADTEKTYVVKGFEDMSVARVKWPMSVIRLKGNSIERLVELSDHILNSWRQYSDESVDIISFTGETPHNTITPIVRKKNGLFEVDLVLRNNRTSEEHPDGIFHPHRELHHIKKENIGLIEVMGLAVLPARLKDELKSLEAYLIGECKLESISKESELYKHKSWAEDMISIYDDISLGNVESIIRKEVGIKFAKVLEHCGVFKRDEVGLSAFDKFVASL
ncbi:UDP-glucose--hexose-1-phosphate uridylyltransferase [Clostridium manihotivorum]|uniref:Galactose-1-phosphate uridylyltransferase n=1 Tax=Clostridium manihotivorum TaxID=2320868 RepID=A0A410DMI5_9CLOT|nr:UDP-glucose--hexose-1-phosphate uridylyltransferase [Clostridium manihotivorum]QAA30292.1 UDP-glucose--hexose-1-phosphate uridylyltransferase [Clostridium manihotivorum]